MKKFTLLASLIVGVMFVVACGGGDDGGSDSPAATSAPAPTATTAPAPTVDAGPDPAELIATGKTKYGSCSACHGLDGRGVPGLGKDLVESAFMDGLSDAELVDFIKVGRGPSDEGNTTGIAMPPKGGNPSLSDDDLLAIVAYIDSL
ncbi:MAG: cytochrome c [Chloroflexi bacterium]|nr:cytochrome c [Chloroflexota bacterium]MBT4072825.1 cytochrome c [Chloroflexota bacterium]MBT4515721.1 cytochrome c [Chloroflexota bacterium]MBT5318392.1 cytochrome c [Chloroflexota bacterium]MBT6680828.1 cytochrome c [Chloroflexota bacterium]